LKQIEPFFTKILMNGWAYEKMGVLKLSFRRKIQKRWFISHLMTDPTRNGHP